MGWFVLNGIFWLHWQRHSRNWVEWNIEGALPENAIRITIEKGRAMTKESLKLKVLKFENSVCWHICNSRICCTFRRGQADRWNFHKHKSYPQPDAHPYGWTAFEQYKTEISDIDAIAVNAGPGSFTGVRIGVAAVKGLAFANNIPCVSVSTLESMAYNFLSTDCIVCAVMDARCSQVYNALFEIKNGVVTRLCDDRALSLNDLKTNCCLLTEESL